MPSIIWINAVILLIEPLGTNLSEILIVIQTFLLKKISLKMSSAKCYQFRLGLNALTLALLSLDTDSRLRTFWPQIPRCYSAKSIINNVRKSIWGIVYLKYGMSPLNCSKVLPIILCSFHEQHMGTWKFIIEKSMQKLQSLQKQLIGILTHICQYPGLTVQGWCINQSPHIRNKLDNSIYCQAKVLNIPQNV